MATIAVNGEHREVPKGQTVADISIAGYLFWPEEFGVDYAKQYPNIGKWLERIKALPGWVHPYELMPGHPRPATS